MSDVVDLEERQPHLLIDTSTEDVARIHVLPVAHVRRWLADPVANADLLPVELLQRIVGEWFEGRGLGS